VKHGKLLGGWLASALVVLIWPGLAGAENWPNWRGPEQNGVCKETNLPFVWNATKNIAWKLRMPGMGGSTPVIWGDRIFLTSADGDDVVLLCASTAGKQLWKKTVGKGAMLYMRGEGNQASASPSTDGKHVWAFVGTGDFACFDFDGNKTWSFNVQDRYGMFKINHGIHTTPVLLGDRLYLCLLHANVHLLIALDKETGKEMWKIDRPHSAMGESKEAYTTPCIWHEGKETCLVILGNDVATCHRITDGIEVWRVGGFNPSKPGGKYITSHRIISSPAAEGDLLVIPTCRNLDIFAMKPGAHGNLQPGNSNELWRKTKGGPDVPCPLVHDGLVYLCAAEDGFLTCLDGKTGNALWDEKLHPYRYRASPVFADGKVYLMSRDGFCTVVKAGKTLETLAVNELQEEFTASPAIANGRLYLRGFDNLYAIEGTGK
jgi:outer membrane protein assembly factor BamB